MKQFLISFFLLLVSNTVFSQVAIGKEAISSQSVSLEFGSENKGLILPWVPIEAVLANLQEPGTLVLATQGNISQVGFKKNTDWGVLTDNGTVNSTLQDNLTEKPASKVSIGTPTNTDGILVLEDTNKAMILPKVASPHLNIIKPEPGTIVFDTVKQQLAVFNGVQWYFWN